MSNYDAFLEEGAGGGGGGGGERGGRDDLFSFKTQHHTVVIDSNHTKT